MKRNVIHIRKWPQRHIPSESEIEQLLLAEGLRPQRWEAEPGQVFQAAQREQAAVIFVVNGSITFGFPIEGEPTLLRTGDRLDLPANIMHNAVVGEDGVVILEAPQKKVDSGASE